MKLEWEKLYTNDKYEMWIAQTTIGQCYIRHGFERDNWCAGVGVFDYTEDVTNFEAAEQYINESHNRRIAAIAEANGYVKAEDYEALKAKVTELTDQLTDATDTLDQIEAESSCFDGLARSAGYVKLEPGQVVATMTLVYAAKFRMDDEILRGEETNFEAYEEAVKIIAHFEAIKEARDARV